ncbi:MAG: hypothetical protein E7613_08140 [Ruminococcaceae bacterium]|nr:hypothetical protein [Oscillospiraceae bacterium]
MRKPEKNYEFRHKMLKIHREDIRDKKLVPSFDEIEIKDGFVIDISRTMTEVVLTAAKDLQDYLLISMGVSVLIDTKGSVAGESISVDIAPNKLTNAKGYMGYKLSFDKGIKIDAFDERGIAQAFYYLEDMMTLRSAPFIKKEVIENKAMYSPRMIHSGFGIDQFPDCHLRDIAHSGMDAILVFTKDVNTTTCGFLDFNELIVRAAKYGIDVYAYSYMKSKFHPLDEGAEEYYESTYGRLFEKCPGLKGVTLVGESVGFPSRDPMVNQKNSDLKSSSWPCTDYPQWLECIKKVIRRHKEDADIVLWSYNWGWAPEENRVELIRNLPKDISLLATFELDEVYKKDGVIERTADYTLCIPGPGKYFLSEAKAAKENGIRLYSMVNTGGLTWDFGTIPYEPFPYQWKKRYDNMKKCHDEYGLCGIMESHHFGFYPSFISQYAKYCFTDSTNQKDYLKDILAAEYGQENLGAVDSALKVWSEAITYMIATGADQYGGLRIGPGYPLCLWGEQVPPCAPHAHFGSRKSVIVVDYIGYGRTGHTDLSMPQIRIPHETSSFIKMKELMEEGIGILEEIENKNDNLEELLDLGKYIRCCLVTTINVKLFSTEKVKFYAEEDPATMKKHLDRMEEIALAEIENTKSAIPLVRMNSRLGWEPSMEYLADEEHLLWKIAQVEKMIAVDLGEFKEAIKNDLN